MRVSPQNAVDAVRILWRMARKDFRPDPCVFYGAGSVFQLETVPARVGQTDGELIGRGRFSIGVEPLSARVLVPRRGGG